MPKFNVLSGTWYHIEAPDEETAEKAYDAYWGEEDMPEGCKVVEGEVDSQWEEAVPPPPFGLEPAW
jgi:beta-galactosidase/beta-glucuronidase